MQSPKPVAQIVSCPMFSKFDLTVDILYCEKCEFFDKRLESDSESSNGLILCNFPRKLRIYSMAR